MEHSKSGTFSVKLSVGINPVSSIWFLRAENYLYFPLENEQKYMYFLKI